MATTGKPSSISAMGPCFISPAGVGLGVQVADLLELERALVAGGGPHAPADEQGACRVHHGVGRRLHRRIAVGEDALDLLGGIGQLAEQQA